MNHVPILFSIVFFYLMDNSFILMYAAGQNGPPMTLPSYHKSIKGQIGFNISLLCPFMGQPQPIYEWYRDEERITSFWERYHLDENVLTIHSITCEDQGPYICKAINGFGSEVLALELEITDGCNNEFEDDQEDEKFNFQSAGSIPIILNKKLKNKNRHILKPEGSSVEMKCHAAGHPVPNITWFRNRIEIYNDHNKINIHHSFGQESDSTIAKTRIRSILQINQLIGIDSANYTCQATNSYGSAEENFHLEVVERAIPQQPKLDPIYPSDSSAEMGQSASLTCKAKSELPTEIHWLKGLKNKPITEMNPLDQHPVLIQNKTILMNGTYYQLLPSKPTVNTEGNYYLSKLLFPKANDENDTGTYVCLALNNVGYTFREVYFNVINPLTKTEGNPDPTTAIIVCLLVLLCFGALGGVCFVWRKRKQNVKSGLLGSNPRSNPNSQLPNHRLTNPESLETGAPLIPNHLPSYPVFRDGRNEYVHWESSPRILNQNIYPDGRVYHMNSESSPRSEKMIQKRVYYGRNMTKQHRNPYRNPEYPEQYLPNPYSHPQNRIQYSSDPIDKYYRSGFHSSSSNSCYYVPHSSGRIPRPSPETSFDHSFHV